MKKPVNKANTKVKKKDNSYVSPPIIFGSSSQTYRVNVLDYLNSSSISYNVSLSLGDRNVVVSSFISLISWALQKIVVVDQNDKEVSSWIASRMLSDALDIFWHKKSMREYVYNTINQFVCTGMKITAPIEVNENWESTKIVVLDWRKLNIQKTNESEKVYYWWQLLQSYEKFIIKPALNRIWYWDCVFTWAIKDALLWQGIVDASIAFYDNNADPSTIHILWWDNVQLTKEAVEAYEIKLKDRHQWVGKSWLPLASNIIKDVKVIDASKPIIASIDQRLHTSNTLAMQLNVDIRALGRMRDWWSQAEMTEVYNQLNTVIDKWNELLSESINNEFNELVGDTGMYKFKFIPKYYSSKQQKIQNCLEAKRLWMNIDEAWALDLIYNS